MGPNRGESSAQDAVRQRVHAAVPTRPLMDATNGRISIMNILLLSVDFRNAGRIVIRRHHPAFMLCYRCKTMSLILR